MASRLKRSKLVKHKPIKQRHYDDKLYEELSDVIENLTHSGNKTLNKTMLDKMKDIFK